MWPSVSNGLRGECQAALGLALVSLTTPVSPSGLERPGMGPLRSGWGLTMVVKGSTVNTQAD